MYVCTIVALNDQFYYKVFFSLKHTYIVTVSHRSVARASACSSWYTLFQCSK